MNQRTAKLLRKASAITASGVKVASYKQLKNRWNKTPRNVRGKIREEIINAIQKPSHQ